MITKSLTKWSCQEREPFIVSCPQEQLRNLYTATVDLLASMYSTSTSWLLPSNQSFFHCWPILRWGTPLYNAYMYVTCNNKYYTQLHLPPMKCCSTKLMDVFFVLGMFESFNAVLVWRDTYNVHVHTFMHKTWYFTWNKTSVSLQTAVPIKSVHTKQVLRPYR